MRAALTHGLDAARASLAERSSALMRAALAHGLDALRGRSLAGEIERADACCADAADGVGMRMFPGGAWNVSAL
jgi:hypothetical protein